MILDYTKDYVLENKRVRIEPLKAEHTYHLKKIASQIELWTYFIGRSNGSIDFENYVIDALEHRKLKKEYPFALFDKATETFAGCTRFFNYDPELQNIKLGHTWLGKEYWGTGLNKNCKYLLFQFAFEKLEVERIGLGAHEQNTRSISAMKSVGCKEEGVIRNSFPSINKRGRSNAVLLSIVKDEWFKITKYKLQTQL